MARGSGFERYPDAESVALRALLLLPGSTIERHASRVLERSLAFARNSDVEETSVLRGALSARREAFRGDAAIKALRDVKLPDERHLLDRVIEVIAAVSPSIAAERIASALRSVRNEYARTKEEEVRTALVTQLSVLFDILDSLARTDPAHTRPAVRDLPRRATPNVFAERLLNALELVNALDLAMPGAFLRAAALSSSDGARRALRHGLRRANIGPEELQAVLAGLARWGIEDEAMRADARNLLARRSSVMPVVDQLGYLARQGSPSIATALSDSDDLVKEILEEAANELHASTERTKQLLDAAAAWSSGTRSVRKSAAAGYSSLLDVVKTEEQLSLVVSGALAFFHEPESVERVKLLRSSLRRALERLGSIESSDTRGLLEQAATQLRIEQPTEHWFTDLIRGSRRRGQR